MKIRAMFVDSHCHLDYHERDGDLDEVVARAGRAGVGTLVTICTKMGNFETVRSIAERYDNVWCSLGIHPHEAGNEAVPTVDKLVALEYLAYDHRQDHSDDASQKPNKHTLFYESHEYLSIACSECF